MDTVSVIIPVYKVEKYLRKCVDSVINQTYKNLEIFLVDDGSPDNCPQICDEYAAKDSRIKVIHKKNGGLSDARNAALDVMTGEYVTFVDSDDYIAEDAIETMYKAIVRNDADIAVGNMIAFYEDGREEKLYYRAEEKLLKGDEILTTLYRPNACSKLYKSELYKSVRFPAGKLYEDAFVYHKLLAQTKRMVLTGKTAYYYLTRPDSIMRSEYNIRFTDIVYALDDRIKWLDSIGQTELANEARMFIYPRTAVAFAQLDKKVPENKEKLTDIKRIYDGCYKVLMREKNVSIKQKFRLWLLYRFPSLHSKLFGRKMPLALG